MKKEDLSSNQFRKENLRSLYREKRKSISAERRNEASQKAFSFLKKFSLKHHLILSFASTPFEIDLWKYNCFLSEEGKLILPKVEKEHIECYKVNDIKDLTEGQYSLLEPKKACDNIKLDQIDCILVPALIFAKNQHRIGYGKGYYDRLLSLIPEKCASVGVGFKEQSCASIPIDPWDQKLDEVYLF